MITDDSEQGDTEVVTNAEEASRNCDPSANSPSQGEGDYGAQGAPESPPPQAPRSLLFSGIYRGYVTLGNHGLYYAMGINNGQNYVYLGYDPHGDSSWFDDMIRPIEETDVPPYYPRQGSNWGLTR